MTTHAEPHGHEEHHHHITPVRTLVLNFLALTALMLLTIGAAQAPTGWSLLNNAIAIGIATVKAVLVILIFMGVKWNTGLIKGYVVLGFLGILMMLLMFCDYGTRHWEPVRGWGHTAPLGLPRAKEPAELGILPKDKVKVDESGH